MEDKKMELFGWFGTKERTFKVEEIDELIEEIKKFNAGAIDEYLTKHVDQVFARWLEEKKSN